MSIAEEQNQRGGVTIARLLMSFGPLLFLAALVVVFTVLKPSFIDPINLFNITRQISITGLIALGMTFVILTAGIDLSVGSLLAFCGMVAAVVAKGGTANTLSLSTSGTQGFGWFAALLAAVVVGALAGGVQGFAITRLKVPPFVVTLGGLTVFRGLTLTISNGGPISGFDASMRWFGTGLIGPVPVPALIFAIAAILCHIVLRYTRYGRAVYAVGGNAEAARLSGLRVDRILVSVYVIVGFFAGLAAFVLSARLNSSEAVAGIGYELTVISAVVIGGTSLFGGIGSVGGTVVGAALIGVLQNGLQFNNVSSYTQSIVIGLILILAVAFDRWLKSRVRRRGGGFSFSPSCGRRENRLPRCLQKSSPETRKWRYRAAAAQAACLASWPKRRKKRARRSCCLALARSGKRRSWRQRGMLRQPAMKRAASSTASCADSAGPIAARNSSSDGFNSSMTALRLK